MNEDDWVISFYEMVIYIWTHLDTDTGSARRVGWSGDAAVPRNKEFAKEGSCDEQRWAWETGARTSENWSRIGATACPRTYALWGHAYNKLEWKVYAISTQLKSTCLLEELDRAPQAASCRLSSLISTCSGKPNVILDYRLNIQLQSTMDNHISYFEVKSSFLFGG